MYILAILEIECDFRFGGRWLLRPLKQPKHSSLKKNSSDIFYLIKTSNSTSNAMRTFIFLVNKAEIHLKQIQMFHSSADKIIIHKNNVNSIQFENRIQFWAIRTVAETTSAINILTCWKYSSIEFHQQPTTQETKFFFTF